MIKRFCSVLALLTFVYIEISVISHRSSERQNMARNKFRLNLTLETRQNNTSHTASCYCGSLRKRADQCEFMLNQSFLIHQPALGDVIRSEPCLLLDEWLVSTERTGIDPKYSIVLTVWNQESNVNNTIMALLKYTLGNWELIIVFDQCRDNSIDIVQQIHFKGSNPTLLHVRLINQPTGVGETSANNIGMRASHMSTFFFILVQDDQIMTVPGWNILLAEPALTYSDVFSVSARCAHTYWSNARPSSVGRCGEDISKPLSLSAIEKCRFYVRDSGNRGPLLLNADRTRQLGYLDEENYWLGNDDHDLNFRAYLSHGWVAGFRPIDFDAPLEFGGTRRKIHISQTKDEEEYRHRRTKISALKLSAVEKFLSKNWKREDSFVTLDINSSVMNLRTALKNTPTFRKLTKSHDEIRPLNQCNLSIHSF